MCDRMLEVHATLPADAFFTCYHYCRSCGGYVPGKMAERRMDTPDTPSGRHGVEYRCRRCGHVLHFESDADMAAAVADAEARLEAAEGVRRAKPFMVTGLFRRLLAWWRGEADGGDR